MKIGIVLESSLNIPGGVQEYALGLYDFLEGQGHHVEILTSGKPHENTENRNISYLGRSFEIPLFWTSASTPIVIMTGRSIKKFLAEKKFDILHFMEPSIIFNWQILIRSRAANVLTFCSFHTGIRPLLLSLLKPVGKALTKKIKVKIAVSEPASFYARKLYPNPYKVIPAGIDLSRFTPDGPKEKSLFGKEINILFVGRLDKRKGIFYLLQAYADVSKTHACRLLIAGDGPKKKAAEQWVSENKVKNIHFLGYVENDSLPDIYRSADIFCSPATHGESFGVVLLEAMASGLPVVAFANRGYKEVMGDGILGEFLVPPRDLKSLTLKLKGLIEDEKLRRKLKQKSLEKAQQYSWENIGPKILDIYTRVHNKP